MLSSDIWQKSLHLSIIRPMMNLITYEKAVMSEIYNICESGNNNEKNKTISTLKAGKIKSSTCFSCSEKINRYGLILSCNHPLDVVCAKALGKFPKDIQCDKCSDKSNIGNRNPNLEKKIQTLFNSPKQELITDIYDNCMNVEEQKLKDFTEDTLEKRFEMSDIIDDEYNLIVSQSLNKILLTDDYVF